MLNWSDAAGTAEADPLLCCALWRLRLLPQTLRRVRTCARPYRLPSAQHCEDRLFPCQGSIAANDARFVSYRRQSAHQRLAGAAWPIRQLTTQQPRLADYVSPVDGMVTATQIQSAAGPGDAFWPATGTAAARAASATSRHAIVVPVPLAFERVRQRGFNQSQHIAQAIAATTQSRLVANRLLRIRHTPPQQSLALKERRRNVRGAFAVEGSLAGQYLFVVDDVMTTGSTLDEIARVLKQGRRRARA